MSKKIRGICLIVFGFLLLSVGIVLYALYDQQDQVAGQNAEILLTQILRGEEEIQTLPTPSEELDMPTKTYAGYDVIGILQIPDVGIELPVLDSWDDAMLEVAPCLYAGTDPDQDMIVMGHNYKSHFRPLHGIEKGMDVIFVSVEGTSYHYDVAKTEQMHKSELQKLQSDYPLTLFTCTTGGQNRLLVRCER